MVKRLPANIVYECVFLFVAWALNPALTALAVSLDFANQI